MRICYENYLDTATISASPVATTTHPVSNLQDQRLTTQFLATSTAAQTIYMELTKNDTAWAEDRVTPEGNTRVTPEGDTRVVSLIEPAVRVFALIGHNITEFATVTFTGGTTSAASESSAQTIIYNERMMLLFVGEMNYRFWKLVISGNDVAPEIGRVWIGDYIDIDPSSLLDFKVIKKRSDTVSHNQHRQKYASEGEGWRRFELSFPPSEEAMINKLADMYDYSRNHSSMIFCNFDTIRDYQIVEPCYVSIDGELGFTHNQRMDWRWSMNLEEEL